MLFPLADFPPLKRYPTFKVGDYVRTQYIFSGRRRLGTVVRRNGGYVYVQLNIGYEIEAYDSELELAKRKGKPSQD